MKIEKYNPEDARLQQIPQTMPTKFSFARWYPEENTVVRLHELVMCRDFLTDVIYANAYKQESAIYGFVCSPDRIPIDREKLCLLVKHANKQAADCFKSNAEHIITKFELQEGIKPSEFKHYHNYTLILGDPVWQESSVMISLFSLLVRCSAYSYNDVNNWAEELKTRYIGNDSQLISTSWNKIVQLSGRIVDLLTGKGVTGWSGERDRPIQTIHNSSGVYTIFMDWSFDENAYNRAVREALKQGDSQ